jgi:hypothetical protein
MRLTACLGILFFVLLAPGAMAADNCQAPPGTSGIDEYCEALPTPGGSGSHHGGSGHGGQKKDQVPPSTRKALQKQGDNGAAVLALTQNAPTAPTGTTQSSTPAPTTTHHRHHSQAGGSQTSGTATTTPSTPSQTNATPAPAAPASNPASAVGDSFGGSLGAGFLALLAGIAVVMALVAWLGRRRGPGSAEA